MRRLLAFSTMLAVFVLNLCAQTATGGYVSGRVIDNENRPMASATVRIEGTSAGAHTGMDGLFTVEGVAAGRHTLVIEYLGCRPYRGDIEVTAGQTTDVGTVTLEESRKSIGEVTVVGTTEARRLQQQAYAVSVLDLKRNYNSAAPMGRLLNTVGSVRMREDGGLGSDYSFSLNGFSGNQVRFFLDGIPMDNFGKSFNLSSFSANMADRIEVYKGVLPVYLGGDALGGAVNIVTRRNANYLDATYSYGSFNTHRAAVNGAFTSKNGLTLRLNAFYNYSDNDYRVYAPILDLQTNNVTRNEWVDRFHDGYHSIGMKLEAGVVDKKYADYLLLGVIVSGSNNDVQTGATMDKVLGGVRARSRSVIPTLRYKKDDLLAKGLSLSLYGTYNIVDEYNVDTLARTYNWKGEWIAASSKGEGYYTDSHIYNREWQGNATLNYVIGQHQSLTLNHAVTALARHSDDAVHRDDPMNDRMQHLTKNITGLGWQIRYDRWNANVFGKMYNLYSSAYKLIGQFTSDQHWEVLENNGTDFGYGAAATYFMAPWLQAKASYEHAYRLPEAIEMFGDGLLQARNPDLRPESSHNVNVSLSVDKYLSAHHISAEAGFIYRDSKDFIRRGVSATANPTTSYKNVGKVRTLGGEFSFTYDYARRYRIGGGLTYQDITDRQKTVKNDSYAGESTMANPTYKQQMPNIPYLFAHATAGLTLNNLIVKGSQLTVDYFLNYVHDYYLAFPKLGSKDSKSIIPMQLSHDIAVGYSLCGGRYNIVAECTNLTDRKLYDNFRLQKPGRAFAVKFRYFINK